MPSPPQSALLVKSDLLRVQTSVSGPTHFQQSTPTPLQGELYLRTEPTSELELESVSLLSGPNNSTHSFIGDNVVNLNSMVKHREGIS